MSFISWNAREQISIKNPNQIEKYKGGYQVRFRDFDEKWLDRNIDLDEYFKNKGKK